MECWLIGAGTMAQNYARVLQDLGQDLNVIGRGSESAKTFEQATGIHVRTGGVEAAIDALGTPGQAIVAVGVHQLANSAEQLIKAGTRRILIEKPGGLNTAEIHALQNAATEHGAEVMIAYNRRFYASVVAARRLIADDGGATSFTFEFTEWSHTIGPMTMGEGVKEAWFTANSTHVVDLAFHLCGLPKDWQGWHEGGLEWHSAAARFCGAGITDQGVLFSYHADWEAPGRWGLEILTRKRRFIFRPMEQLQVLALGSVRPELVEIDDQLDQQYKPGLYAQTKAFLQRDDLALCRLDEQLQRSSIYDKMAGYN
jgi:predicted dehydrogenase